MNFSAHRLILKNFCIRTLQNSMKIEPGMRLKASIEAVEKPFTLFLYLKNAMDVFLTAELCPILSYGDFNIFPSLVTSVVKSSRHEKFDGNTSN